MKNFNNTPFEKYCEWCKKNDIERTALKSVFKYNREVARG